MKGRCTALLFGVLLSAQGLAQESDSATDTSPSLDMTQPLDLSNLNLSAPGGLGLEAPETSDIAPNAYRFTLGYELSALTNDWSELVNNRSWIRFEYSKFFSNNLYVRLDTKQNVYWSQDHRAEALDRTVYFENSTPEAFVQYSRPDGQTAFRLGVQRMIWGESQAGAITDEVSPRNLSELFLVPLEESRLGQFMLSVDHFSSLGDFTAFYVPRPRFNKYADEDTAYYLDPFDGQAYVHDVVGSDRNEYGMRWRKAYSGSDVSLMAASLIDNDYAMRYDGVDADGRLHMTRLANRIGMVGGAFNYASGKFLYRGELAYKSGRLFSDANYQLVEKDVIDAALGFTYSLGGSNTIGMEVVNSHVVDWDSSITGIPRDTTSLVLDANLFFLNDMLSVSWLTVFTQPYTSIQTSIRTAYKWSDNLTYSLDLHALAVPDENNALYPFRDMHQVVLRAEYRF
ncbi:DUF1302 family protein [Bordetella tumulicola]|uniref:DUF1302 family protein n=1 Tax=Bordetella tumulicola TaxID=1649133 RepID=UPI0039F0370E